MKFILLDNFNGDLNIITIKDSGESLVFDSYEEAKEAMSEECQNGIVVPLGDFMSAIKDSSDFVSMAKFELGEDCDEGGNDLETTLNSFLI